MSAVANAIKKVATGPELSKDLTQAESRLALEEILAGDVDPARAAVFFIAMRMKRETVAENLGMLEAMQAYTDSFSVALDDVLLLTEPFNGFTKHYPISAFLPVVLAACGLPTLSQGVSMMGPKFGMTHEQVLSACGVNTQLSTAEAAQQLTNAQIGWAYVDQSRVSPAIFALQALRTQMIKRPSLTTLEKLTMPVRGKRTHLITGYVHKAYPAVLGELTAAFGYTSALIIRGVEGGITPTLREMSQHYRQQQGVALEKFDLDPKDFDIYQNTRGVVAEQTMTAQQVAEKGIAALRGEQGSAFDSLLLVASMVLWKMDFAENPHAANVRVREVLLSGEAYQRLQQVIS